MRNHSHRIQTSPHRSNGAVMVVTMVMLLLISAIGVSGMQAARLETQMAVNMKQKQTSFNNAESSVGFGETTWDQSVVSCLEDIPNCPNSILLNLTPDQMPTVDGVPDLGSISWGSANSASYTVTTGEGDEEETTVYEYGKYVVEFLGARPVAGDAEKFVFVYRVTASGTDESGESTTLVQTLFRRCIKIDGVPCPS